MANVSNLSAGRCNRKEAGAGGSETLSETHLFPSRSTALLTSGLFSLAVLRKSHHALCKRHNTGSQNRGPDLLRWPCWVFTPLRVQQRDLRDPFHQRKVGFLLRLVPLCGHFVTRQLQFDSPGVNLQCHTPPFVESGGFQKEFHFVWKNTAGSRGVMILCTIFIPQGQF